MIMTQDERWQSNYEEVMRFVKANYRNLSKYNLEERRLYTWLKHNRKQMNAKGTGGRVPVSRIIGVINNQ